MLARDKSDEYTFKNMYKYYITLGVGGDFPILQEMSPYCYTTNIARK
ncbi:MAG: hypothetical protein ABSB40_07045 [Nitrososphaeria archaeon]